MFLALYSIVHAVNTVLKIRTLSTKRVQQSEQFGKHQLAFPFCSAVPMDVCITLLTITVVYDFREVVKEAFDLWSRQIENPDLRSVKLSFSEAPNSDLADINILWASG